jgi:catechol 2,3-dioxygenase-like lactoylglutathione lyase family enzyme
MIDHIVLNVSDLGRSRRFYTAALMPLGYRVAKELTAGVGFGVGSRADIWLWRRDPPMAGVHVALLCATRSMVDAFHAAALAAGGRDNGAPGPRPIYHPHYYGAFILDPDGHNFEAVCHEPPARPATPRKPARRTTAAPKSPARKRPSRKPAARKRGRAARR